MQSSFCSSTSSSSSSSTAASSGSVANYLKEVNQKRGIRMGLASIMNLLALMGNPHQSLKVIHVTGTNGKGSFTAFMNAILRQSGYSVGVYTSPWLVDVCESVVYNDLPISPEALSATLAEVREKAQEVSPPPTEFELMTATAFLYFHRRKPDLTIVEVGMGGLTDATNVFDSPLLSVIMSIDFDHMKFLGSSIPEISKQKAGIIQPNTGSVVLAPQTHSDAVKICQERATACGVPCHCIKHSDVQAICYELQQTTFDYNPFSTCSTCNQCSNQKLSLHGKLESLFCAQSYTFGLSLLGSYQPFNAAVAIHCAYVLFEMFSYHRITTPSLRAGICQAKWPCRFELCQVSPFPVVIDGAHNPAGVLQLRNSLNCYFFTTSHSSTSVAITPVEGDIISKQPKQPRLPVSSLAMVLAMNRDKDLKQYLRTLLQSVENESQLIPTLQQIQIWAVSSPRSPNPLPADTLAEGIKQILGGAFGNIQFVEGCSSLSGTDRERNTVNQVIVCVKSASGNIELAVLEALSFAREFQKTARQCWKDVSGFNNRSSLVLVTGSLYMVGFARKIVLSSIQSAKK